MAFSEEFGKLDLVSLQCVFTLRLTLALDDAVVDRMSVDLNNAFEARKNTLAEWAGDVQKARIFVTNCVSGALGLLGLSHG